MFKSHFAAASLVIAATACQATPPPQSEPDNARTSSSKPTDATSIPAAEHAIWAALAGTYEIIAVRRASETAAPLHAVDTGHDPRGGTLTISMGKVDMTGITCDGWSVSTEPGPDVMDRDPMLDDLRLPVLDSHAVQTGIVYDLRCEDAHVLTLYQADPRAIAIPWDNGASYLIAEKPLSETGIRKFQDHMIDMKFQSGMPSTEWSPSGLIGLRAYYAYRANTKDAYIFERPAITQSLLEGLSGLPGE